MTFKPEHTEQALHLSRIGPVVVFGASGNIGGAVAARLISAGERVVLTYNSNESAAQEICASFPESIAFQCDVRVSADVASVFEKAKSHFGCIRSVLYAVGGLRRTGAAVHAISDEYIEEVLTTHLKGAICCCREAARSLEAPASIVLISSVLGSRGYIEGESLLAAAKAGVERFVQHAAIELAKDGLRVNAVAPGYVKTGSNEPGDPAILSSLASATPLGRPGSLDDVVEAVLYLFAEKANWITGEVLHVDGGLFR